MTFKHLKKIIFHKSDSLKTVLEGLNKTAQYTEEKGFAIVVDDEGKCIGVVSDGDIRRKLVKEVSLEDQVLLVINKNYNYVTLGDNPHKILRQFDKNTSNLPVLNIFGIPVDLFQYSKFIAANFAQERIIRARVPVRVSYSGGGTDMSSYINVAESAVLSSTINKYCTSSILMRNDNEVHIHSKDLGLKYSAKSFGEIQFGDELDLIKAAIKVMEPDFGFNIETFAEFSPGTGLGGSSALVVSVLGALNYFRNERQLDHYQLADLAYQVERIDMKIKGGWQDQYATTFGGFNWIEFNKKEILVYPLQLQRGTQLELEYNLMLFKLGGTRSSSEIQKKLLQKGTNKSYSEMLHIAKLMRDSLLKGRVKEFGDLLHESWELKKSINKKVSSEFVSNCYDTVKKLGALGGKLLGAGKTGYLLVYASPLYQKKITEELAKKGVIRENFKFSNMGLEVWSTKR